MDYTVHRILQARKPEQVAFFFSRGSSQPRDRTHPHCRQIFYELSHKGSPRILEWVTYPFSSGSSWPRNWTGLSCIAGGFFTSWGNKQNLKRKNWYKRTYLQKGHRLTDLREQMVTRGKEFEGGTDWEFGIDMYTLLYLKQITNRDLLYITGNCAQYSVIT